MRGELGVGTGDPPCVRDSGGPPSHRGPAAARVSDAGQLCPSVGLSSRGGGNHSKKDLRHLGFLPVRLERSCPSRPRASLVPGQYLVSALALPRGPASQAAPPPSSACTLGLGPKAHGSRLVSRDCRKPVAQLLGLRFPSVCLFECGC